MRLALVKNSFFHFINYYLKDEFSLLPADFHLQMVEALQSVDDENRYLAILGFRGSAKTTLLEAYATWSLLNGRHNTIVFMGNVESDAKASLANIRSRIEDNEMIRKDFGIKMDTKRTGLIKERWSEGQLTIGNSTIVARSRGQKVRGMKFNQARIDLIIADDLEDVKDASTREKREATRRWFFSEVLPATKQGVLADNVKVVLLGNLVHKDCLIKHLSKGEIVKTMEFWLYDENGKITWEALYPNEEAVQKEKEKILLAGEGMGEIIWAREYLGIEIDPEDAVLKRSDIQYYPKEWLQRTIVGSGVGVDFAISKKETADYTAMVKGCEVMGDEGKRKLLILPNSIEKRLNFQETIQTAVEINNEMPHGTKFYPEKVGYQESAHEIMRKNGLTVVPMSATTDKRARAESACFYVKTGRVLFPEEGAEDLINNLVGFGVEQHDDLTDAFSYLVLGMIKNQVGELLA